MRELRVQSGGRPLRVFYAFDPRRVAILLIGGDKTGQDRFYEVHLPLADRLYDEHLIELNKEGLSASPSKIWQGRWASRRRPSPRWSSAPT
jgi:hypothetical protein